MVKNGKKHFEEILKRKTDPPREDHFGEQALNKIVTELQSPTEIQN